MTLPIPQVDRFYTIWKHLLYFTNQRLKLVAKFNILEPGAQITTSDAILLRNALWKQADLFDEFITRNPGELSESDLNIAKSWKYRREGTFFIYQSLKKHAIFIDDQNPPEVYAVKGLYSPFETIFPFLPYLVKTVLFPFEDEIIADGLYESYNISFGSGIRSSFKDAYNDAKERGEIITSLLPEAQSLSAQDRMAKAAATNGKVLKDFEKSLFRSGTSPKIAMRDLETVAHYAEILQRAMPQPRSLREIDPMDLSAYLESLPEPERRPAVTGFNRFVKFMRDTARLDWDRAEDVLEFLKSL